MPENKEEMMDYDAMLDELVSEYPQAAEEAEALKSALAESMPESEDEDMEMDFEDEDDLEMEEDYEDEEEEMEFPDDEDEEELPFA